MHVVAGDAERTEHVDVAGIVFDADGDLEAVLEQLGRGASFEVGRRGVVAIGTHQQDVVANIVFGQPPLGLSPYRRRSGREEDERHRRVDSVDQRLSAGHDGIGTAGQKNPSQSGSARRM
ncbi:MAG: hypothetical protein H6512_13290 [Acidimicrobiia bacterium]|nr:hypothetical protein [Acidimicrobiia bacterium]